MMQEISKQRLGEVADFLETAGKMDGIESLVAATDIAKKWGLKVINGYRIDVDVNIVEVDTGKNVYHYGSTVQEDNGGARNFGSVSEAGEEVSSIIKRLQAQGSD